MFRARLVLGALGALVTSAALLAWSAETEAQTLPSLDVRTWSPSIDPEANFVLEPTSTPGPWRWNASAWLQYAYQPVTVRDGNGLTPVANLVGADLVAALGIGQRVSAGIDVPAFLWQDGTTGMPASVVTSGAAAKTGLGDVSLSAKVTLLSDDHMGTPSGFGLAALGRLSLPTGDRSGFMGDGDVTGSLRLLAGFTIGPASARASLGYGLRSDPHAWPSSGPLAGPTYGATLPWSIGLTLRPRAVAPSLDPGDRQTWEIAGHGALPAGPVGPFAGTGASALSPALLAIDDRVALGHYHDAYLVAAGDIGLDRATGTPVVRAVLAFGWAPRSHDKDDDGVDDDADQCPELPEDRDGIQDQDGCPEDDADDDGVPDAQDACPLAPGSPSEDPHRNGCPGAGGAEGTGGAR
jgi:hypothetical protein